MQEDPCPGSRSRPACEEVKLSALLLTNAASIEVSHPYGIECKCMLREEKVRSDVVARPTALPGREAAAWEATSRRTGRH